MLTGKIFSSRERQYSIVVREKEPLELAYVFQPKLAVASVVATLPDSRTTLHGVEDAGNEKLTWRKSRKRPDKMQDIITRTAGRTSRHNPMRGNGHLPWDCRISASQP